MGYQELNRTVRGSGGTLATNTTGTIETDNYTVGGGFSVGAGTNTYPHTIDPTETIQELNITDTGKKIVADLTTKSGDTINGVNLRGVAIALDTVEVDSITFKDPDASGAETHGFWVGE